MKICPQCGSENQDALPACQECGIKIETRNSEDKPFSTTEKIYYWLGAWGGVILFVLVINPASILAAPFFPIGLLALLPNGAEKAIMAWMVGGWMIGWVFYILLSVVMFQAKKANIFIIFYVIFCIFLALNVVGCQRTMTAVSGIH